ncbi:mitochondrial genome maintenance MGM101-domain-containing protein [Spinellus fusiger]|nr:mitochondrial genome maintenance MGM101-domain-containing protein [Spinellus fusiger]
MFTLTHFSASLKRTGLSSRLLPSLARTVSTTREVRVGKSSDVQVYSSKIDKFRTERPKPTYVRSTSTPAVQKEEIVEKEVKEYKPTPTSSSSPTTATATTTATSINGAQTSYFPTADTFDRSLEEFDDENSRNWSTSFHGLSTQPFTNEVAKMLMQPIDTKDIEVKPDGLLYLPEIKYRRILNTAFGPGGWGLAPRSEHSISPKNVSREYALICHGRFVSQARGEQDFFDISGLPTASEGCKSNALMRCCKDLGIASELWDPVFIRKYKRENCVEVWAEHVATKKKKKLWKKKGESIDYPYKESTA